MSQFNVEGYDDEHYRRTEDYVRLVRNIYNAAIREAVRRGVSVTYNSTKPFKFDDFPTVRRSIRKLFEDVADKIEATILDGMAQEWDFADVKNDAFVKSLFKTDNFSDRATARLLGRNRAAMLAFQKRKTEVLGLSDRVWKYTRQFQSEIEMALEVGIGEGKSADQISRDMRGYLQEPERLYRRVREKEGGQLRISKHAAEFHPGRGIYRSSYKNAQRLARTEINMAYRTADHERWQKLDFVVGIEVRRSNNPYPCDVCENLKGRYPKGFVFRGFHPNCRCYAVSILISDAEMNEMELMLLNGEDTSGFKSKNEVKTLPAGFTNWITENKPRLLRAQSQPYFIQDNFKDGRVSGGYRIGI